MSRPQCVVTHLNTRGTGVSLELPVAFAASSVEAEAASYVLTPVDGSAAENAPTVRVQAIGTFAHDPGADPDATIAARLTLLRETADAVAATGTVRSRTVGRRDGAVTEEVDVTEPDGNRMWATVALTAGRLVSIVVRVTAQDLTDDAAAGWDVIVEEMRSSLRFVAVDDAGTVDPDGSWSTLADLDLGVSLEAPVDWEAVPHDGLLLKASQESVEGILPLVAVAEAEPGGDTWEWFDVFTQSVLTELTEHGAADLDTQRYALSSVGADVFTVTTRLGVEGDPTDPPRIQMAGWIWAGPTWMYTVQAHTAPSRAAEDMATFDRMVRSIRLLSKR